MHVAIAVLACACLAGCGGGSTHSKVAANTASDAAAQTTSIPVPAASSASQREVVARVGGQSITRGTLEHWIKIGNPQKEVPEPPSYSACVTHLQAAAKPGAAHVAQTPSQLKSICRQHYQELMSPALSSVIHSKWLIGEAADEHVKVSEPEVQREFEASKKESYRTDAEFQRYLSSSGQTVPDLIFSLKLNQLSDKLFKRLAKKEHGPSHAEVARFYNQHKQAFSVPEGRDVRILRTTTGAAALNAKRRLQTGASFETVAGSLSAIAQPIGTKKGLVMGLVPHHYSEKVLNNAIFTARLNRVYGPLRITAGGPVIPPEPDNGYFVFEVTRTVPAKQKALAQVEGKIKQYLTEELKKRALFDFVKAFRVKWTAKTDCQPAYVVQDCRQFKPTSTTPPGDPYAL